MSERDAQRAGLQYKFERIATTGHAQFAFVLHNRGPALASEIHIELQGSAIREHSKMVDPEVVSELAPGAEFRCGNLAPMGDGTKRTGKLRWKDGSGELQEVPISFRPW